MTRDDPVWPKPQSAPQHGSDVTGETAPATSEAAPLAALGGHAHGHHHGHAPHSHGGSKPKPVLLQPTGAATISAPSHAPAPGLSILRMSLGSRLVLTGVLVAILWAAVTLAKA